MATRSDRGGQIRDHEQSAGSRARPLPELRLQRVGADRIDVLAVGAFDDEHIDAIRQRLARLQSGRSVRLRVDCSAMVSLDVEVANLIFEAAARVRHYGGTLELLNVPDAVIAASAAFVRSDDVAS